jgi:hypothetical protein
VRYLNGDEVQYVISAFECDVIGGVLRDSSEETTAARYWSEAEARSIQLAGWLRHVISALYAREPFEQPTWTPPDLQGKSGTGS